MKSALFATLSLVGTAIGSIISPPEREFSSLATRQNTNPDSCKGYIAKNIKTSSNGLTADLTLAATCGIHGPDMKRLTLRVTYEDKSRIHVKIGDSEGKRYEVPEEVFPRPTSKVTASSADIEFKYVANPFSFSVIRKKTGEVLFDTKGSTLVFEEQYLRLKTAVPNNANIYGLGEHANTFRLDPFNTTRTLWNRDFGVIPGNNLYGAHPVYFEHRTTGTHAVLLLNSNGMDVKLRPGSLEYNVIGGILDFYFIGGNDGKTGPADVARGYAKLAGLPASVPYWSLGLHQCRYGYHDFTYVADVITNYSAAGIPLETMWTDIDYMYARQVFTNDPQYFPTSKMQEIVKYLHDHDQQYIVMVDPAVAYQPDKGYKPYDRGASDGIFLKNFNGSVHKGVVWPGVAVFPDWFHPNVSSYWNKEFKEFFDPNTGIDIDGVWLDMNEPSSFCKYPCNNPEEQAVGNPPPRTTSPPDINTPIFVNNTKRGLVTRQSSTEINYNEPPYKIGDIFPYIGDRTAPVDAKHYNGLLEYDTHNLYGTMMSSKSRDAMLQRRPGLKPLLITRSTFAGAGTKTGKWLGDNFSAWEDYRFSIAGMLAMAGIYQMPMVGSDACGFGGNTTETLCARWAMLGAFNPFFRNHYSDTSISQEFYLWPTVAQAAKSAISIRQLLDYMYTALQQAHEDGSPILNSLWFKYPQDANTYPIDLQFFYGDSVLVSPVTAENATSVDIYLPKDTFYDFLTYQPVEGNGATVSLTNVNFTSIPVHIRGGSVLPLRSSSAMTTKALREKDFNFVVAPGSDGKASGQLYIDDGISIKPKSSTRLTMSYSNKQLQVKGSTGYKTSSKVATVTFLGVTSAPNAVYVDSNKASPSSWKYDSNAKTVAVKVGKPPGAFSVHLA
ncbi:glycoside hydrolase family 31 protein [Ceratobasidium sp. AG-Ba]|nr:glycoside hydrolase family 31 protein [Ceratobasidium sp. AG-Ba]QRW06447.1 glycoside hydrolase family 31 protein [Ceratobasidium sp. AG-Ba]